MIINSNSLTFIDTTDTKKIDIRISSNHPVVQIYDVNQNTYTPSWTEGETTAPLKLDALVYADSLNVTSSSTIQWFKNNTNGTPIQTGSSLVIPNNVLNANESIVEYICKATYNETPYENRITFSLITTGKNGANGQDGEDGRDGTSVTIRGLAYSNATPIAGNPIDIYSNPSVYNNETKISGTENGESYLVSGYLCVYNTTTERFVCTGKIQGPKGEQGDSYYLFIRYANDQYGAGMDSSPVNKTYIGFYTTLVNEPPTDPSLITWRKFVGEDAKNITLSASAQVFKTNKEGEMSPSTITVTAQADNTSVTSWNYSTDGGRNWVDSLTGVSQNNNVVTINGASLLSTSVTIKASDGVRNDIFTVYKVFDGVDGDNAEPTPTVFLTNENVSFSANADGQVAGTTIYTHVVAYNGSTKVTPSIGEIPRAILPTGMSIGEPIAEANEQKIPITIANNTNLGSEQSNHGTITIPVISPVNTNLRLSWSKINTGIKGDKGATGRGISKITEYYLVTSDSSGVTTDLAGWTTTIQSVTSDKKYLWNYEIITYTDNTTSSTLPMIIGVYGNTGATGKGIKSVTEYYLATTQSSGVTTSTTGWTTTIQTLTSTNKYLWNYELITYTDDSKATINPVIIGVYGDKGDTGNAGRGVSSIVEQYYQSTSATSQTGGFWSATVPTWVDGTYIWTRSVITYTDATIFTTSPVCITGQKGMSGVGVSSVDVWYYQSSSATSLSGGSWSTTAPTWVDGKYMWTKTITTYTNNTTDETDAVCITGQKGATGAQGIQGIQGPKGEQGVQGPAGIDGKTSYFHIKYSNNSNGNPMTETPSTYIGTYVDYTEADSTDYTKYTWSRFVGSQGAKGDQGIAGTNGEDGKTSYLHIAYATSANGSSGFSVSDSVGKTYIGQYTDYTQADSTDYTKYKWTLIKGDKGDQGPKGNDAYTVMLTNESHIFAGDISNAIAGSTTTQVVAYNGSIVQTVTIVSVNGKTATTTDTDTGIAGLKFKCSALSGTSPTITFTCTTSFVNKSGTIPIVLSVGGVQFTKMFTYSIAFKGSTGAQGATGQVGTPASLVDITPSALYFKSTTGKDGTFTPDYIYLYPRFQTVTYSAWQYSVDGGVTWVAASGANGLTIGTYNSTANTLRIAKTSTLYTDTVTSISFRCVSSNASVYDTVSIAKIYDVVDLEIGGRNLLHRTDNTLKTSTINTNKYGVIGQFVPSTQSWKNGYVNISEYGLSIGDTLTFQAYLTPQNEIPIAVRAWGSDNGTSGSPLKDGNYLSEPGVSSCTFTMTHPYIYLGIAVQNTITESITEKYSNCKLERGNKATDWSPAPEDMISITFQLYAPKGSLITKDIPEVTLETFAYDGSQPINGATFVWYSWVNDAWVAISGATGTSLTLNKDSVLKSNVYKCKMTYKGKAYESTATVEDKTDIYESIMCISSNARGNNCYWVLYTLVYTDAEEVDPLLGPISINAPDSPVSGDYWYAVDETNASMQLKKYNGATWVNSTDTQSLSYYWDIVNNGSEKVPFGDHSKVQVVSCNDFTSTATLVCGVNNAEDGLLTQSSLSLTDASDPIVSTTEPSNVVDGQLWIKPNNNGTYIMSIWDAANNVWVVNDMDTRTKVHTSKPSVYSVGDLWITASDTEHSGYLEGTLLMANTSSSTFSESHWSTTLKYDKDLDSIKETLNDLSQYVNITSEGLKIGAQSASGEISPFTSLFTSTELAFYQNSDKLLTLANNQLTAPHIVVEDELEVGKSINLGNLSLTIETNGSFSFAVSK